MTIQSYVASGGRYIGFCLGAYFAGSDPGFELLPSGIDTDQYITSRGASVKHDKDTIVQVDWLSGAPAQQGPYFGAGRWLFFQDGPLIDISEANLPAAARVLGQYRSNRALAAFLSPYEKGWVGIIGPHPEADQSWCKFDRDIMLPPRALTSLIFTFLIAFSFGAHHVFRRRYSGSP